MKVLVKAGTWKKGTQPPVDPPFMHLLREIPQLLRERQAEGPAGAERRLRKWLKLFADSWPKFRRYLEELDLEGEEPEIFITHWAPEVAAGILLGIEEDVPGLFELGRGPGMEIDGVEDTAEPAAEPETAPPENISGLHLVLRLVPQAP